MMGITKFLEMRNPDRERIFRFKQFEVSNHLSAMKVGTDGVLIGGWAFSSIPSDFAGKAIDVGCGTGVIALMLAQRFKNMNIEGIEIMRDAAEEASYNFTCSPWASRLAVCNSDYMSYIARETNSGINFIISNPPYFSNGALAQDFARRVARHEGNLHFKMLIETGKNMLADNGRLALILPSESIDEIMAESKKGELSIDRICRVSSVPGRPTKRVMVEFVKASDRENETYEEESLTIHSVSGDFSPEYRKLLADFYLKF